MSESAAEARVRFLGLAFDPLTLDQALDWLASRDAVAPFAYVITPNVDHMVRLEHAVPPIQRAYQTADLCVCDSRVLARLAGLAGQPLTVVPGSDLTPAALSKVYGAGDRICLIGGTAEAARVLEARHPGLVVLQHSPPMGLIHDADARRAAILFAAETKARAVLLAVGSPQQELLAWEMRDSGLVRGTALCIGASVDFLVGTQVRAPVLVQRAGFEWAWRLARNPQRLWRRYLVDGPAIFPLVWRWRRDRRGQGK